MHDYWLYRSALGFSKETKMGYLCKTLDYGYANACAHHLIQWNELTAILLTEKLEWGEWLPQMHVLTWRSF